MQQSLLTIGLMLLGLGGRAAGLGIKSSRAVKTAVAGGEGQDGGLVQRATSWCGLNGLMYTDGKLSWSHAPVTLCPSPYPRAAFEYAQQIQPSLNQLIDNIARDREFLVNCLAPVAASDNFVKRLLDIYAKVPEETIKNGVNLGIHRSDYMLNDAAPVMSMSAPSTADIVPLQIEINTIASSFGCLSKKVGDLHRHLLMRSSSSSSSSSNDMKSVIQAVDWPAPLATDLAYAAGYIPENSSIRKLAFTLALAHFLSRDSAAIILFIVQPGERNIADQRLLEAELWHGHGVRVEFMTLAQLAANGRQRSEDNALFVHNVRVSVAYFRAGYSPDDYPSEAEWRARTLVEESACVKCPSVGYQLAGTKRVQQALCDDGAVERFLSSPEEAQLVRRCFAAQYSLGASATPASARAVEMAKNDGSQWVLKPQREGGGNNLYGSELSAFLRDHATDSVLDSYVLMQRIFPKPLKAAFLRGGKLEVLSSVSELGIYGTFLGDGGKEPVMNDYAGYLLRTKPTGVDEGGVATGYSVLNSPALV